MSSLDEIRSTSGFLNSVHLTQNQTLQMLQAIVILDLDCSKSLSHAPHTFCWSVTCKLSVLAVVFEQSTASCWSSSRLAPLLFWLATNMASLFTLSCPPCSPLIWRWTASTALWRHCSWTVDVHTQFGQNCQSKDILDRRETWFVTEPQNAFVFAGLEPEVNLWSLGLRVLAKWLQHHLVLRDWLHLSPVNSEQGYPIINTTNWMMATHNMRQIIHPGVSYTTYAGLK